MEIITGVLAFSRLREMAEGFGGLVKAVVDIERRIIAVDADLHSDLEALLLADGSKQENLWGINIYPEIEDNFIEFDSIINMRPRQGNMSRHVEKEEIRKKIISTVNDRIKK